MGIGGEQDIERDAWETRMQKSNDSVGGKRIEVCPIMVCAELTSCQQCGQLRTLGFMRHSQEIDMFGGSDAPPGAKRKGADEAVRRCRIG